MEKTINPTVFGRFTTKRMTFIALFTALAVVFTNILPPITFPIMPVPITLQTLIVMLTGLFLKPTDAFLSMFIYVCLGAVGLPVYSGGTGGMGVLASPSGGFILAFPVAAFLISSSRIIIDKQFHANSFLHTASMMIINTLFGVIFINAIGSMTISAYSGITYYKALMVILIYIPGDLIKAFIASNVKMSLKHYTFYK